MSDIDKAIRRGRRAIEKAGREKAKAERLLALASMKVAELTAKEMVFYLARRMDVSRQTVRSWIRRDIIRAIRTPTGRWRIPPEEVQRVIDGKYSERKEK